MRMYVWSQKPNFIAVAQAESVEKAREAVLAEIGDGDGSCAERIKAQEYVTLTHPAIWFGTNAEFELTDSAAVREMDEFCRRQEKAIKYLESRLGNDPADHQKVLSILKGE